MIQNAPEIMHPSALPFPLPKAIPVTPLLSPMSLSGNTYPLPPLPKTGKDDSGNPTCGHEKTPAWGTGAATRRREWGIACCMLLSGGRRNPSPFFKKIPNTIIAENNLPPCADSPHARNARSGSVPPKNNPSNPFRKACKFLPSNNLYDSDSRRIPHPPIIRHPPRSCQRLPSHRFSNPVDAHVRKNTLTDAKNCCRV